MVILFSLANTLAIFQVYINRALYNLLDQFYIVYLDDILIFSQSEEEYIQYIREVFRRLRTYRLYAKRSKCRFYTNLVIFLGFIIHPKGLKQNKSALKRLTNSLFQSAYSTYNSLLAIQDFTAILLRDSRLSISLSQLPRIVGRLGKLIGRKTGSGRLRKPRRPSNG